PLETVEHVALTAPAYFFLNAAPALGPVPAADLTIVNRYELEALTHRDGLIAVTLGAEGAILLEGGEEVARAAPPKVEAVDGTGAGDAFTACLVVSLLEGLGRDDALRRACAAGALAGRGDIPVAAGADRPLRRELRTAAHVHGETGLDGPDLPEPATTSVSAHAADFLADLLEPGVVLVPTGPLTNVALLFQRHPE